MIVGTVLASASSLFTSMEFSNVKIFRGSEEAQHSGQSCNNTNSGKC